MAEPLYVEPGREHFRVSEMSNEPEGRLVNALFGSRKPKEDIIEPDEITQPAEITQLTSFEKLRDNLNAYKATLVNLAAEEREYNMEVDQKRQTFTDRRVEAERQINALETQIARHIQSVFPDRELVPRAHNHEETTTDDGNDYNG